VRTFGLLVVLAVCAPTMALAAPPPWMIPGPGPVIRAHQLPPLPARGVTTTPAFDMEAIQGARYLGPANLGRMSIDLAMNMRDEEGLLRYAALANNPRSLYYRHFLTPAQLGEFFGAPRADYDAAMRYFWSHGLLVRGWKSRQMLRVVGAQTEIERALSTRFGWYRKNGVTFFGPTSVPRFATPLAVRAVGGIVSFHRMRRHAIVAGPFYPAQGVSPGLIIGYSPFDIAAAFDYTGAYHVTANCCTGKGITMGVVGTGPISAGDVPYFRSLFHVSGTGTVQQIDATDAVFTQNPSLSCCYSTGLTAPPAVTAPCSSGLPACNPEDFEAQLDTEQTSSLAPDATVNFYLAYNPSECFGGPPPCGPQIGVAEGDDELQQIIDDNVADVVSGSYGIGELDFAGNSGGLLNSDGSGVEPAIFASLAAEGVATFFSSGDSGAEGCQLDGVSATADVLCAVYPADDPNVTSVGGTTTPIGHDGRFSGIVAAWGVQTLSGGAGGGGFSTVFSRPAFEPAGQFCANMKDSNNRQCDSTHRIFPDLALNADVTTAVALVVDCGTGPNCSGLGGVQIGPIGGTSASSQEMAAMWALVLESCKQTAGCDTAPYAVKYRLGNPAPLLYGLSANARASVFYDVTYGLIAAPLSTNQIPGGPPDYSVIDPGYTAGPGFDLATGLGTPFARNLIHAITGM
jgi:subtilase family serine protease